MIFTHRLAVVNILAIGLGVEHDLRHHRAWDEAPVTVDLLILEVDRGEVPRASTALPLPAEYVHRGGGGLEAGEGGSSEGKEVSDERLEERGDD